MWGEAAMGCYLITDLGLSSDKAGKALALSQGGDDLAQEGGEVAWDA